VARTPAAYDDGYRDTSYRETARQPQPAPAPAQPNYVGIGTGAVIGGLIGNQVGGGRGKALATVAGVIGGGMLGNAVQNQVAAAATLKNLPRSALACDAHCASAQLRFPATNHRRPRRFLIVGPR
jgi:uncharacterized protein YcfJ